MGLGLGLGYGLGVRLGVFRLTPTLTLPSSRGAPAHAFSAHYEARYPSVHAPDFPPPEFQPSQVPLVHQHTPLQSPSSPPLQARGPNPTPHPNPNPNPNLNPNP